MGIVCGIVCLLSSLSAVQSVCCPYVPTPLRYPTTLLSSVISPLALEHMLPSYHLSVRTDGWPPFASSSWGKIPSLFRRTSFWGGRELPRTLDLRGIRICRMSASPKRGGIWDWLRKGWLLVLAGILFLPRYVCTGMCQNLAIYVKCRVCLCDQELGV